MLLALLFNERVPIGSEPWLWCHGRGVEELERTLAVLFGNE